MRKADIARHFFQQAGISEHEAAELLEWILALFTSTLQKGEPIAIAGFGTFRVRGKGPRKGRNPRTGEEIMIPARRVVTFHASPVFKAAVSLDQQPSSEP